MNISRIQTEFSNAQQHFTNVELYPTTDGKVYVKVVLQPTPLQFYVVTINFPDNYPNLMPSVYITKPVIELSPHRYNTGNICYLHPTMWNPGIHNLSFVIQRAAKWLSKYEIWKRSRVWPGAEIKH
ncbi:MAG TPA: ubiquitin-conjugating enzyme E2 variant [Candidatus Wunengus sp. YC60]|uniref:ubiquitin-conjugating enzyme E2 variant n=1 Tax=Candidatus Wunengus sp. YC60 TaxID=3367697 RepID=UPI00402834FE